MNISPIQAGSLAGAAQSSASAKGVISSDFETFLKMLTVQMQNQDPSDPMKSEDFAVQLATFSGVEQQVRTNDLLAALGAQMGLAGMAQMAGWVGMEARAAVAGYFDSAPITLSPNPALIADKVNLIVRDENGNEVQRVSIPVSAEAIEWAGVSDDGTPFATGLYTFEIESLSSGTVVSTQPVEIYTTIIEARSSGGQTILVTRGGAEIPAIAVTGLRDPDLKI